MDLAFVVWCLDCLYEWCELDPDEDTFCPKCGSYDVQVED